MALTAQRRKQILPTHSDGLATEANRAGVREKKHPRPCDRGCFVRNQEARRSREIPWAGLIWARSKGMVELRIDRVIDPDLSC